MKELLLVFLLAVLLSRSRAEYSEPMVQVYTRLPEEFGKNNSFICHVSAFHPPLITIELLENGKKIPGADQTELAFVEDWKYQLTKYVNVTLKQGHKLECRVDHMGKTSTHSLNLDI